MKRLHVHVSVDDLAQSHAERPTVEAKNATCCYAKSDKQWIADPQGIPWETFFTYGESTVYAKARLPSSKR